MLFNAKNVSVKFFQKLHKQTSLKYLLFISHNQPISFKSPPQDGWEQFTKVCISERGDGGEVVDYAKSNKILPNKSFFLTL